MKSSTIRILLIGNYSIFRNALRMLLETEKKLKVIGETADLAAVGEIIGSDIPDLILVDLPEREDPDFFQFLQQIPLTAPVLILAGCPDAEIYKKCLKYGIGGLVLKEKSAETLFKAIEKVHQGELWFERTMMGKIIQNLVNEKSASDQNSGANLINTFTEREKQVLDLICLGLKNKLIAEKLFITETTVRHHLTSIFNKLEISTRLELVIYAFRHDLVKVPDKPDKFAGGGSASAAGANEFSNGYQNSWDAKFQPIS